MIKVIHLKQGQETKFKTAKGDRVIPFDRTENKHQFIIAKFLRNPDGSPRKQASPTSNMLINVYEN